MDASEHATVVAVEAVAAATGWELTAREPALAFRAEGAWSDYVMDVSEEDGALKLRCGFALAPPPDRRREVARLAMALGRGFARGRLSLDGTADRGWYEEAVTGGTHALRDAMRRALATCDLVLFPAFHRVAWGETEAAEVLTDLCFNEAPLH